MGRSFAFEKILKYYKRYCAELGKEVQTLLILEGLKSADATSNLLRRLEEIPQLVISVASTLNDLAKWLITEKPNVQGPNWFQLGSASREPFHLFVSLDEAQEVADIAKEIIIIAGRNDFQDMSKFDALHKLCAPKMKPLSTGSLLFFAQLDDSDTASDPSNEQVETIQSLIDTSRELDETKFKLEVERACILTQMMRKNSLHQVRSNLLRKVRY